VTGLRKGTEVCEAFRARGLLEAGQVRRMALVARLTPTLKRAGSEPAPAAVSGESLGQALGLTPSALRKEVEHLCSMGFAVESVPGKGYRLARPFADLVTAEGVLPLLLEQVDPASSWVAGLPYRYRLRCESTNLALREEAASSPPGTLMVADEQTRGRGRLGRTWVSAPGKDLTFSVLLSPSATPALAPLLSLAAALAAAEVLEAIPGLAGRVQVKWPNDVLLDGKKVCGILLESCMGAERMEWLIAGIGLNVNSDPAALPRELDPGDRGACSGKPRPTSMRESLGHEVARGPLLAGLLARLTRRWTEGATSDLLDQLRARDFLRGRQVEILSGPTDNVPVMAGEALGIGPEGQLLVRDRTGATVPVFAGEVTVHGGPLTGPVDGG
jgi:BirA family biotin operon repressor/biotin-[acetyl-CoA-carboxylase] ligase